MAGPRRLHGLSATRATSRLGDPCGTTLPRHWRASADAVVAPLSAPGPLPFFLGSPNLPFLQKAETSLAWRSASPAFVRGVSAAPPRLSQAVARKRDPHSTRRPRAPSYASRRGPAREAAWAVEFRLGLLGVCEALVRMRCVACSPVISHACGTRVRRPDARVVVLQGRICPLF